MQIGSFGDDGGAGAPAGSMGAYPESENSTEEWGYDEEVNVVGPYKGGYWQSTGKSGSWKGKGKRKRRGERKERRRKRGQQQVAGNCGGNHYASDCPKGKYKGKRKHTAYGLQEDDNDWDSWSQSSEPIRQLSWMETIEQRNPHVRVRTTTKP